jgi:SAM-dependent methyltransferase
VFRVLESECPDWRSLRVHESSGCGPFARKLARECPGHVRTQLFAGVPPGEIRDGVRCEDLSRQTWPDAAFDVVISQDVFEHVLEPAAAFREVGRTLVPGGRHIWTVPWSPHGDTVARAVGEPNCGIRHCRAPEYHADHASRSGVPAVTDWGRDLPNRVLE